MKPCCPVTRVSGMPVSNEKLHHVNVKEKTERETAQGQSHRDERQGCTSIARIRHESCSWSHQRLVPKRRCSHDFWQGRTHTYKPIAGQPSRKVKQMSTSNRQPPTENKETVPPTVTWDQTWTESNDCAVTPSTWKGFNLSARKSYAQKTSSSKTAVQGGWAASPCCLGTTSRLAENVACNYALYSHSHKPT